MKIFSLIFSFALILSTDVLLAQMEAPPLEESTVESSPALPESSVSPSESFVTPSETAQPDPKKKIVYREKSYFDFEDTLINGNLRKPDGSFIFRKDQQAFSSDLRLKRSFLPEMRESSQMTR